MSTDPNPIDAIRNIDTKRSVVHANPDRPEIVDLLEAEGRMPGIRLQEHVVLVREVAYRLWERAIQRPKLGGGINVSQLTCFASLEICTGLSNKLVELPCL